MTASINPSNNTLQIVAANGYAFDFAGRLPSAPIPGQGNIAASISGSYTGSTNDTYTYTVSGAGAGGGTVGVTPGLTLQVTDGNNNLLGSFNIGQGYSPGSALAAINGVTANIASGTVNNGDSFQVPVTANPDTGNLLTALGLNTLFTGNDAATLAVQPGLIGQAQLLSGSLDGDPGDGSNFTKIANVQNAPLLSNGTQTLSQYFANTVSDVGVRVQNLTNQQTAQQALGQQLSANSRPSPAWIPTSN